MNFYLNKTWANLGKVVVNLLVAYCLSLNLWRFEFAWGGLSVTIEHGWASGLEWLRFSSANMRRKRCTLIDFGSIKTRAEQYFL